MRFGFENEKDLQQVERSRGAGVQGTTVLHTSRQATSALVADMMSRVIFMVSGIIYSAGDHDDTFNTSAGCPTIAKLQRSKADSLCTHAYSLATPGNDLRQRCPNALFWSIV